MKGIVDERVQQTGLQVGLRKSRPSAKLCPNAYRADGQASDQRTFRHAQSVGRQARERQPVAEIWSTPPRNEKAQTTLPRARRPYSHPDPRLVDPNRLIILTYEVLTHQVGLPDLRRALTIGRVIQQRSLRILLKLHSLGVGVAAYGPIYADRGRSHSSQCRGNR